MKNKIRIAIDVSPLSDGNSIRGVGHYTNHLVKALQQEIKTNPEYKNWQIDLTKNINDLQSTTYDLIHYPYFDPFKLTLPKKGSTPIIITVHDLIPIQFKKEFPVGIKGTLKWLIQKNNLKKSNLIITVSNYSKQIIKDIVKYPDRKIFVTYEAADSSFKQIKDINLLKSIKEKYNLPNKFILYVGDINWNKNIPNLAKACISLNYPLVIVGSAAKREKVENHPWNKDLIWLQSQKNKNLIFTGFVSDEELPVIYNLATFYCQPSFAEGFGLPLIQSMQSGTPVVFSNKTCIPEIMEDNGISFNPYSIKDIKLKLKKLWESPVLREKYSKMGIIRAKQFDWKFTAIQTLSSYKLLLSDEK
jgi:glycosyltransferase involved in cell wall biosynthesis